jgi:hypothetical protein
MVRPNIHTYRLGESESATVDADLLGFASRADGNRLSAEQHVKTRRCPRLHTYIYTYIHMHACRRLGYVWKICMTSCLVALLNVCLFTPMALCGLSVLPHVLHTQAQRCLISNIAYAAPMA